MRFNVVKTLIIEAEMVLVHRTRIQVIFSELIRIFLTVFLVRWKGRTQQHAIISEES